MFFVLKIPGKQPGLVRTGPAPASSKNTSCCEAGLEHAAIHLDKAVNWQMLGRWKPCQSCSCKHFQKPNNALATGWPLLWAGREPCFARSLLLLDQSLKWERLWTIRVECSGEELLSYGIKVETRLQSLGHYKRERRRLLKLHKKLHEDLKSLKAAMEMQKGLGCWQRLQSWMELARPDEKRGGEKVNRQKG